MCAWTGCGTTGYLLFPGPHTPYLLYRISNGKQLYYDKDIEFEIE